MQVCVESVNLVTYLWLLTIIFDLWNQLSEITELSKSHARVTRWSPSGNVKFILKKNTSFSVRTEAFNKLYFILKSYQWWILQLKNNACNLSECSLESEFCRTLPQDHLCASWGSSLCCRNWLNNERNLMMVPNTRIQLFQKRLLLWSMMHDPCFIARSALWEQT